MAKKLPGALVFVFLFGLSLFFLNCGSSSSRPAGVLFVASQGAANVGSYSINLNSGNLSLINTTAATQTKPTTMLLDPSGQVAFVLNTGSNSITAYTVNNDGSLAATGSAQPTGANPQSMARDPGGKFLFVANQDDNTVSVFTMQSGSATLTPVAAFPTGVQPVGVAVDPSAALLYVVNQSDNTVSEFAVAADGTLTPEPGSPYTTGPTPSSVLAVKTAANNLFVYVTNTSTANNISVFQVCTAQNATCSASDVSNATMIPVGSPVSAGLGPAAITVDPTNSFLYVVNRTSAQVSSFRINASTGALNTITPATVSTGSNPVAIAMHPTGKFLYVSSNGSSNISGYNVNTTSGALGSPINVTSSAQPFGIVAK